MGRQTAISRGASATFALSDLRKCNLRDLDARARERAIEIRVGVEGCEGCQRLHGPLAGRLQPPHPAVLDHLEAAVDLAADLA